ncbi:nucleobase:cation symporter-2 family protein [Clostridium sediminicola]|uniref:nucleobase:cation symporter-2 family protein n=1 Tax=Clostridium sediminicola TaxID=3114879 RepID=UPI0031F1E9A4
MSNKTDKKVAVVDEVLPFKQMLIFGFQHILIMCSGAVSIPLIVGNAAGLSNEEIIFLINADLFIAGIATLIQSLGFGKFIGGKIPMVEGASFAGINAMVAIASTYKGEPMTAITTIFGSVFIAGIFCFIMAPFWAKLIRFFPNVVTGTVITIIGLSLIPVTVRWSAGGNVAAPNFASSENIFMAIFVLGIILCLSQFLKGILGNLSILFGLIIGTIVATFTGMADFSSVSEAAWISVNIPFHFGFPRFDVSAIVSMILVMVVIMTAATGNIVTVHEIVEKPMDDKSLARGLRSEGFVTMIAAIFNTFPQSVYAQNVGLLSLTGIKSRFVVATSGGILVCLGLFPKMGAVVTSIPYPVLGGAGFIMFGMVIAAGVKSLGRVNFDGSKNGVIVAVSIGISMISTVVPEFYHDFPQWVNTFFSSGITTGSLSAILLNLFFNEMSTKKVENISRTKLVKNN